MTVADAIQIAISLFVLIGTAWQIFGPYIKDKICKKKKRKQEIVQKYYRDIETMIKAGLTLEQVCRIIKGRSLILALDEAKHLEEYENILQFGGMREGLVKYQLKDQYIAADLDVGVYKKHAKLALKKYMKYKSLGA